MKVIPTNSLQPSVPLTTLPEQHGRHGPFKSLIPQGATPTNTFLSDWKHLGVSQKTYFLSNHNVPSGQIFRLLSMLRHLKWRLSGNNQEVIPCWDSCYVDSASCCLLFFFFLIPSLDSEGKVVDTEYYLRDWQWMCFMYRDFVTRLENLLPPVSLHLCSSYLSLCQLQFCTLSLWARGNTAHVDCTPNLSN